MKQKIISQKMLSTECWLIQVWGNEACRKCDYRNSKNCGGRKIIREGKNIPGYDIPLPDVDVKKIKRRKNESS